MTFNTVKKEIKEKVDTVFRIGKNQKWIGGSAIFMNREKKTITIEKPKTKEKSSKKVLLSCTKKKIIFISMCSTYRTKNIRVKNRPNQKSKKFIIAHRRSNKIIAAEKKYFFAFEKKILKKTSPINKRKQKKSNYIYEVSIPNSELKAQMVCWNHFYFHCAGETNQQKNCTH